MLPAVSGSYLELLKRPGRITPGGGFVEEKRKCFVVYCIFQTLLVPLPHQIILPPVYTCRHIFHGRLVEECGVNILASGRRLLLFPDTDKFMRCSRKDTFAQS